MYQHDGQDYFVIDGHTHFWDARPANWRNKYGESWIKCFFAYHGLSPADAMWPFENAHTPTSILISGYVHLRMPLSRRDQSSDAHTPI